MRIVSKLLPFLFSTFDSSGLNVLLTCISILAVDFTIFPRNFAKTETIGLSLMDIGVGTFMISSALTSKYARGITTASTAISVGTFRKLSLQHLLVLLLGVGRFVALKVLNYQEHVSEYGVHWNFFVTLFCVWTVADVVHRTVPRSHIFWISLLWLLLYQIVLIHTPLTAFIFSSERSGLLSANKEGIVSLMGYIPLFLLTEVLAHILFYKPKNVDSVPVASTGTKKEARELDSGHLEDDTDNNPSNLNSALAVNGDTVVSKWDFKMMQKMAYCSLVLWLAWLVANTVQQTSRRLVNLSYVSLVLALTMTTLLMLYVSDTLSGGPNVPVLTLQYLSKHSLLVFLAANVLTGAINMSMHTIYASTPVAFAILLAYSITVTCIAWIAEHVMAPKIDKVRI